MEKGTTSFRVYDHRIFSESLSLLGILHDVSPLITLFILFSIQAFKYSQGNSKIFLKKFKSGKIKMSQSRH